MHARNLAPAQTLPWRSWYNLQRWRTPAKHQLQVEPLCAACLKAGCVTPASIADHVEHHEADWNRFMLGALQSLCAPCHEAKHGRASGVSKEVGADGYPVDPRHPFNKARG